MKSDTPDIVITSHYDPTMAPHMTKVYRDLINRGVDDVVGLWNSNGAAADEGPGRSKAAWCIRDVQNGEKTQYNTHTVDYRECHYGKGDVDTQGNTAMQQVDANLSGFHYIPLQDWMCPADSTVAPRCPGVVGQVTPWRDGAHLTNEWTHSMTDPVHEALYRDGVANSRPNMHKSTRIAGNNRYATSAAVSADASHGQTVYVSTGADFPDTLAAGARAGHVDSAVLLTRPEKLPQQTLHRLVALQPNRVVVTGSSGAVSDGVISQIRTATGVDATRVGGGEPVRDRSQPGHPARLRDQRDGLRHDR